MNSDRFTKVFVSYTLRDACVTVEKLRALKRQLPLGYDSFVDIIDNDSEDKQERVDYELEHCKKMLLVKSENIQNSDWVRHELFKAWSLKLPIEEISTDIRISETMSRHRVFISYHHQNDQWAKDRLIELNDKFNFFIDCSVDTGDIPDDWDDQHIRMEIRDNYLRDSTVTLLLVGEETKNRKHIDWELYSSMFDGTRNKKSGIVVIMLPSTNCTYCQASHAGEKESIYSNVDTWTTVNTRVEFERRFPYMPARIIDNLLAPNVKISVTNWNDLSVEKLSILIDNAANDRASNQYDMSRAMKRKNS
jgi:hypothetical protein